MEMEQGKKIQILMGEIHFHKCQLENFRKCTEENAFVDFRSEVAPRPNRTLTVIDKELVDELLAVAGKYFRAQVEKREKELASL